MFLCVALSSVSLFLLIPAPGACAPSPPPKKKKCASSFYSEPCQIIIPENEGLDHLTQKQYFDSLGSLDKVKVPRMSKHGLKHRPSNHRYRYERDLFRKFIEDNRDSTGRTKDHSGRFHGAE